MVVVLLQTPKKRTRLLTNATVRMIIQIYVWGDDATRINVSEEKNIQDMYEGMAKAMITG